MKGETMERREDLIGNDLPIDNIVIRGAAQNYVQCYRSKLSQGFMLTYRTEFIITIKTIYDNTTLTQVDLDYIKVLLEGDWRFTEFKMTNNQSKIIATIFIKPFYEELSATGTLTLDGLSSRIDAAVRTHEREVARAEAIASGNGSGESSGSSSVDFSLYDADANDIIDNAEKVNGHTVEIDVVATEITDAEIDADFAAASL